MNERNILKRLLHLPPAPGTLVGIGDDCAVIPASGPVLLAADQVVSGVHFDPAKVSPAKAGAKLLKRNLSDVAAMGGIPRWALCTIACRGWSDDAVLEFLDGVRQCAGEYGTSLTGGDLSALPKGGEALLVGSLSIFGELPEGTAVLRSGAREGDLIFCTGAFGDTYESEHHVSFLPRLREGRFLARYASAMMDVTDSLVLDLERMAESSGTGMMLDPARIPLRNPSKGFREAVTGGEDYELVCTVPPGSVRSLTDAWPGDLASLTMIGQVTGGPSAVRTVSGEILQGGYLHEA